MGTLKNKAQSILTEKNNKIIPGNIKKDVQIFDVTGTLDVIDTSDADAREIDIAKYKTAYVDGEKVSGQLEDLRGSSGASGFKVRIDGSTGNSFNIGTSMIDSTSGAIINNGVEMESTLPFTAITNEVGLTADKIKLGVNVLGITGTYDGASVVKIPIHYEEQLFAINFSKIADAIESYIEDVPAHANFVIETDGSDVLYPFIRIATMTSGMANEDMTKPALALSINQTRGEVTLVYVNYEMSGTRSVQSMGTYLVKSTEYMYGDMTLAKLVNLFNFIKEGYISIDADAEIYNDFDNVYFCFSDPSTGELYSISRNIDSSFIRIENK